MKQHQKSFSLFICLFVFTSTAFSQQWGDYTLYSTKNSSAAYLVDTNSTIYHSWTGLSPTTAYSSHLLPGGDLIRTVNHQGNIFNGGALTGEFEKVDYNGNVLWNFTYSTSAYCSHHDICPLPNGNVLVIAYESRTSAQVTQAGCSTAITMWPDKIVEVQQTGSTTGTVVWEWHLWDHLCQDYDPSKDNYVTNTANHPELFDINYNPIKEIWHANGVDYNPVLDQIIISAHNSDEVYIIDHSTTTAEAAGHTGGLGGRGGDFLYRWGKPAVYGQAGPAILDVVHDAHWIPEEYVNEGRIVAFNNHGISTSVSCVDQVSTPLSGYNYLYSPNTAYQPTSYTSRLACTGHTNNEGGSQQLPNGNQLVCIAFSGYIYEVDPSGNTIWSISIPGVVSQAFRYSDCYVNHQPPPIPAITQNGAVLTSSPATVYQWYLNGTRIAGETNQSYTATQSGVYLVRTTDSNGCVYRYSANLIYSAATSVGQNAITNDNYQIYPNPATSIVRIENRSSHPPAFEVSVSDIAGRTILQVKNINFVDLSRFDGGVYNLLITEDDGSSITRKIILIK